MDRESDAEVTMIRDLRHNAVMLEGEAARARVRADDAWAQYRQAIADRHDDALIALLLAKQERAERQRC